MQWLTAIGRWKGDAFLLRRFSSREPFMKSILQMLAITCIAVAGGHASAQDIPLDLGHLKKLSACELTSLFEQAPPGAIPVGDVRGKVLLMTDAKHPRLQACLANLAWKGKHFDSDGTYINQWPGFQALRGKAELGVSGYDGKPCLLFQYPPDTPLFGNMYDEIRQVAPGLYLARLYERCPCPRFRGYFAMSACGSCP